MAAAGNDDGIVSQFLALKRETDADVLAMQCGDFYEFFGDDAELVEDELDLTVSQKGAGDRSYPMAGVPLADLTPYLTALVERGYRVAVADQRETDSGFQRKISRVATPGTLLETTDADAQYLAAVVREGGDENEEGSETASERDRARNDDGNHTSGESRNDEGDGPKEISEDGGTYGLAFADVTTGRFHATTVKGGAAARTELHRFSPAEILGGPNASRALLEDVAGRIETTLTDYDAEAFAPGRARRRLADHFGERAGASAGLEDAAERAAGAILAYVEETGAGVLASMTRLGAYEEDVSLDATTQRNLELAETMQGSREGSLLGTIDHTQTSAGGRLLRERLTRPLRDSKELEARQESVETLCGAALAREELRGILGEAYDLERLASRSVSGTVGPRDLLRVRETLALFPALDAAITDSRLAESPVAAVLDEPDRAAIDELERELDAALAEDPPRTASEGGVIKEGYDAAIDEVVSEYEAVIEWLEAFEAREKRRHGITHLQIDRNKTDGYYIQVGNSETGKTPKEYEEVKTLKNSRRYTTEDLGEREGELLRLEERRADLESKAFEQLRETVAAAAEVLQDAGRALARIDVAGALAVHAVRQDWTRPEFGGGGIDVEAGRHPVVENTTEFVPNDTRLDDERSLLLVTGPNMSGKSTYMRQTALIVLLAQIGSFVPARAAEIEPVDGIFTRVGALDELAQGRSTFMVEMAELSNILHSATAESLVVLDEVGRGTATYDGISIAWAATEYLHNRIKARTLFATHYHELTELVERLGQATNVHVAAEEREGEVTFLHAIQEGAADRSYGVHVAELAGVPDPVVSRSNDVLRNLREENAIEARGGDPGGGGSEDGTHTESGSQQVVFDLGTGGFERGEPAGGGNEDGAGERTDGVSTEAATEPATESIDPAEERVLEELRDADLEGTAPIDLLGEIRAWQERLEES
ncbi:DNA mismatch repair protein MutS [Halobacteriales archaeon QS_3_64_16]|nr:MAG: DNA mismatch repair protein MutS [Halobacteriales archaeon QS_3_64_16]